jgi:hypothetical protein
MLGGLEAKDKHGGGRIVALWVHHENSSFLPTSTNTKILIVLQYSLF